MLNKINTIIALAFIMAFLFPMSEIILSKDKFSHFPAYQTLLFILPYLLLAIAIFKKYEKSYSLEASKSILVTFIIGNILVIEYFFRLNFINIPTSIKMEISSITVAIFSKGYAERHIIGFIAISILLISLFTYVYKLTKKDYIIEVEKNLN